MKRASERGMRKRVRDGVAGRKGDGATSARYGQYGSWGDRPIEGVNGSGVASMCERAPKEDVEGRTCE
jgi:hypothetical protein